MAEYDLTGVDPNFLETDHRFSIFQADQPLTLKRAAFLDTNTFRVHKIVAGQDPVLMIMNVDYEFRSSDYDYNAKSAAQLVNPNFNKTLVKSVLLKTPPVGVNSYQISLQYQCLEQDLSAPLEGDGVEPTPARIKEMLEDIAFLKNVKDPLGDVTSDLIDPITTYAEDITGVATANYIVSERHFVDVPSNKQVIRPMAGAFYNYGLNLVVEASGRVLRKDIDYLVCGVNISRTRVCQHKSGVYDFIFLLTPVVGTIQVTYHAFGGDVSIFDMSYVKDTLKSIIDYLNRGGFLTADSLGTAPALLALTDAVNRLQLQIQSSGIQKSTTNITFGDSFKHWYNVANLFKDSDGALKNADTGTFRIQVPGIDLDLTVSVTVDNASMLKPVTFKVLSFNNRTRPQLFKDYSQLDRQVVTYMRVLWDNDAYCGQILQIGFNKHAYAAGTTAMVVTKLSQDDSWKLYADGSVASGATDTVVTLPDAVTSWNSSLTKSKSLVRMLCPDNGYVIWVGSINTTDCSIPSPYNAGIDYPQYLVMESFSESIFGDIALQDINTVEFIFYNRDTGEVSSIKSDQTPNLKDALLHPTGWMSNSSLIRGNVMYYPDDLAMLEYVISKQYPVTTGSGLTIGLLSRSGPFVATGRVFSIREIIIK